MVVYFESAIDNKLNHINQQLDLLSYDYIDYMTESDLYCEGAEDGFFDGVIKKLGEMIDIVKKKK